MCADFAIHDKGTGNPHVHIMLTVRPLKENGAWAQSAARHTTWTRTASVSPMGKAAGRTTGRTPPTGTTKGMWRFGGRHGPAYTNRALEAAGQPALVDHRSYKRRALIKSPLSTWGQRPARWRSAASAPTREKSTARIAADNKLLKEIKAALPASTTGLRGLRQRRGGPAAQHDGLVGGQQQLKRPDTRTAKSGFAGERRPVSFMQANGIKTMQQLHDKSPT